MRAESREQRAMQLGREHQHGTLTSARICET